MSLFEIQEHGIFADIVRVADALGVPEAGVGLLTTLRARLQNVHTTLKANSALCPRVAVIEWTDPLYVAGHWVPEMVCRAGGLDVLSAPGSYSTIRTVTDVSVAAPDLLCIALCGYDVARGVAETAELLAHPDWGWAAQLFVMPVAFSYHYSDAKRTIVLLDRNTVSTVELDHARLVDYPSFWPVGQTNRY